MDLSYTKNKVTDLSGDWLFYEGILSPEKIDTTQSTYIRVPSYWPVGDELRGYGYGMYHLKLTGVQKEIMALRLGRVHTSYTVWINDQLVHQSGQPAPNKELERPGIDNKPIVFNTPGESFDIYIGVSNYSHARGGLVKPVEIGYAASVNQKWTKKLVRDLVFISIILSVALYSLVMFFVAHHHLPYLYFALFCLFSIVRLISTESLIIGLIAPDTPYYLISVFRYWGVFISTGVTALYCEVLIPTLRRHWIMKLLIGVSFFCAIGVAVAPSWWGTYFSLFFQGTALFSFLFFFPLTIKAILKGRSDLVLISLSVTALIVTFVHDALAVAEVVSQDFWQMYGLATASVFQLAYFAVEYRSLNEKVDGLNANFTSLGIIHQEKSQYEHTLISEINEQLNSGKLDEGFLRSVLKTINNGPFIPANQKVTIQVIEEVTQDFRIKLKKKYPHLTPKETELCLSLKAKLSTKEIASIRNMTTESVKKARSRLRKKLSLEKETDLYTFFESF